MSQFDLTDDQLQIQEMARKFTADAITPASRPSGTRSISSRETRWGRGRAGFGVDLHVRRERRHWPRPARSGADHGGDGLRLPSTSAFISIHNMAMLDDRPFRLSRGEEQISAVADHDGTDRQLLPDRAVSGSDAAALKTKAMLDGDHYIVTGSKRSSRAAEKTKFTS